MWIGFGFFKTVKFLLLFRLLCYFGDKIAAVAENENLSKKLGKIEITKEKKLFIEIHKAQVFFPMVFIMIQRVVVL